MNTLLKQVAALLLSYGFLLLGNGLFMTLLSLRSNLEGFSTQVTGLVMSSFYIGLFVGARYTSLLVNRVGYIRTFSVFASTVSIIPLAHMLWVDPLFWSGLRFINGIAMAGLIMVTESWLNSSVDNKQRGSLLSVYMGVNYLAAGAAQLLLLLQEVSGYQLFVLSSICFSLCLLPVALTRSAEPVPDPPQPMRIKPTLQKTPVGFYCSMCAGFLSASFFSIGPIFALQIGFDSQQIALFMALGVLGGLMLQTLVGKLSDKIERRKVIAVMATLVFLCCLSISWQVSMSFSALALLGSSFIFGCLSFTLYSLAAAHTNDWVVQSERMQTAGALLAGYSIGAVTGPIVSAKAMSWWGPAGLFDAMAISALLITVFTLAKISNFNPKRGISKRQFVPRPNSSFSPGVLYSAVQKNSIPITPLSDTEKADTIEETSRT